MVGGGQLPPCPYGSYGPGLYPIKTFTDRESFVGKRSAYDCKFVRIKSNTTLCRFRTVSYRNMTGWRLLMGEKYLYLYLYTLSMRVCECLCEYAIAGASIVRIRFLECACVLCLLSCIRSEIFTRLCVTVLVYSDSCTRHGKIFKIVFRA